MLFYETVTLFTRLPRGNLVHNGIPELFFSWTMILKSILRQCLWCVSCKQAASPLSVPCHRWEAVQVHLGRLRLEVRALRRADAPLPEAHGRQAVPVRGVQPQLLALRPPGAAHEAAHVAWTPSPSRARPWRVPRAGRGPFPNCDWYLLGPEDRAGRSVATDGAPPTPPPPRPPLETEGRVGEDHGPPWQVLFSKWCNN